MSIKSPEEFDLTTALAHEYYRASNALDTFRLLAPLNLQSPSSKVLKIKLFTAYGDFIAHLFEFYVGCIKKEKKFNNKRRFKGMSIETILNLEVEKILCRRRDAIIKGYAHKNENDISFYEVPVPKDFGDHFKIVRNKMSHAITERAGQGQYPKDITLWDFYQSYHKFVLLLFEDAWWLWGMDAEKLEARNWGEIEAFDLNIKKRDKR